MTVKTLTLTDFRSVKYFSFAGEYAFDSRMNVFYGDNGAGKSTLLDALAFALSWVPAKVRRISELRSRGYDDPELSRAEVLIRRHEVLGK